MTSNDGDIRRANLDGTGQKVLVSGLPNPLGIALYVPEPAALPLLGLSAVGLLRRRARQRRIFVDRARGRCVASTASGVSLTPCRGVGWDCDAMMAA